MNSLPWIYQIYHLPQGVRASQGTTFTVIWTAFIQSKSAILNAMAAQMTQTTGVGVEHTLKRIQRFLSNQRIERRVIYANVTRFVWRRIRHGKTAPIAWEWRAEPK